MTLGLERKSSFHTIKELEFKYQEADSQFMAMFENVIWDGSPGMWAGSLFKSLQGVKIFLDLKIFIKMTR